MAETPTRPARILCLDGGGVKGVATLQILKEIMNAVNQQRTEGQDTPGSRGDIKPCDYFDLICGTSTGGLIALMLGRLEFTVDDAIQRYKQLANDIFKKEKTFSWNAKYDHKPLERKLKEVIRDSALKLGENALLVDNDRPCKSFVVTTNLTSHSAKPVLLRAYETEFEVEPINKKPVKIWEAGRATSAAPTFFGPYKMEDGLEYTDGGTIANNPTELGYQEAGRLWQGRKIDLIVSIGTGPERALTLSSAIEEYVSTFWLGVLRFFPRTYFFRVQLAAYSLAAMTNTERTHERVQENINTFQGITSAAAAAAAATPLPRIYFRLNDEDKSALVQLDACDKMDHLMELAKDYINRRPQERDQIATTLLKTEVGDQDGLTLPPARSAVADDSSKDHFLFETFMTQVQKGNVHAVKTLLERGADVNFTDFMGWTPVIKAAQSGHENMVRLFLEKGANVNSKDVSGDSSLLLAAKNGHQDVVSLLLKKGADINLKNIYGESSLSLAAMNGHQDVVGLLLEKSADINLKNTNGESSLSLAAKYGHQDVVGLLLEKGADIESKNIDGESSLSLAAMYGHQDVVRLLLEKGADIDLKNIDGGSSLLLAAKYGYQDVVRLLLEKGADIDSKNIYGESSLTLAAIYGHQDVVRLLLEKGADIDSKDIWGESSLSVAAKYGYQDVVRLLLEKGADIDSKNIDGESSLRANRPINSMLI